MSESEISPQAAAAARSARGVVDALSAAIPGQALAIETLLVGYLSGGHVLLEGVPGIGKTLLARSLATCLALDFARVQFTPDLMPSDVTGTNVFDPATRSFRLVKGPVFTSVLLADEINRTPPKTQSALLEAMQEAQVTIDATSHALDPGFFVVATQNPIEFEGTYPLPEAQLDRFRLRVRLQLPARDALIEVFRRAVAGSLVGWGEQRLPAPVTSAEQARELRRSSALVHVGDPVLEYLAQLGEVVARSPHVELSISPRGGLALLECARAAALLAERDYVIPDDLKRCLEPCWAHRLLLTAEAELEGHSAGAVLAEAAESVAVPH